MKTFEEIKIDLKQYTEKVGLSLPVKIWISENDNMMCIEIDKLCFTSLELSKIKKYLKLNGFKLFEDGRNYIRKK